MSKDKSLFQLRSVKTKLVIVEEKKKKLNDELREAVVQAKVDGWSWDRIAKVLDVSRQSIQERFGKYVVTQKVTKRVE